MPLHPIDRLILDEVVPYGGADRIAVLDDPTGDLVTAVAARWPAAEVVVQCDSLVDEQAVRSHLTRLADGTAGAGLPVGAVSDSHPRFTIVEERVAALVGADLVLLRLPSSADELAEVAELAVRHGAPGVRLVGGARTKHLTRALNDALARGFHEVRASLGRDKSRVLHAGTARTDVDPQWPRHRFVAELGFEVAAHGGVFAGTRLDRGTRLLLQALDGWVPPAGPVLDLGCGTGILATWLARRHPDLEIVASDVSSAAVASTRRTAPESVRCQRADGLAGWPAGSLGAIVTNPPFHVGAAKDSTPTLQAIHDARTALRPGGELIMVYNAHLPYLPRLRSLEPTRIVTRDREYLVTRTTRA